MMEIDENIFISGSLNIVKYEENFPWERIIIDAMNFGMSVYLIFGNYININFRFLHSTLKRLRLEEKILIRRGFTYYQLLEIVLHLTSYHDMVFFFHDPVSFEDLSAEEKFTLSQAVMLNLAKYAETLESTAIFAHMGNFNFPYHANRVFIKAISNGWKIISQNNERFIYFDKAQVPLDYFMEV